MITSEESIKATLEFGEIEKRGSYSDEYTDGV